MIRVCKMSQRWVVWLVVFCFVVSMLSMRRLQQRSNPLVVESESGAAPEESWVPEHLLSMPVDRLVKSPVLAGVGASEVAAAKESGVRAMVELIMDTGARKTTKDNYYWDSQRWKWKEDLWWLPADTPASFSKDAGMQAPKLAPDRHWQDPAPYELPPATVLQPESQDPVLEWNRRVTEATKAGVKPIPFEPGTHCGPELVMGKHHGWPICPHVIRTKAPCVAYLVGIGAFPQFDATLAGPAFNCEVHNFDPSPTGKQAMEKLRNSGKMPANLHYHDYGVAHEDGEVVTYAPEVGDQYTRDCTQGRNGAECRNVTFQVKTIGTIMRELGHTHLNLLKIDTEGGEFEDVMGMHLDGTLAKVDSYCSEIHYYSTSDENGQMLWNGKEGKFPPGLGWPTESHPKSPGNDPKAWRMNNAAVVNPSNYGRSAELQVLNEIMEQNGLRLYGDGYGGVRSYLGASLAEACWVRPMNQMSVDDLTGHAKMLGISDVEGALAKADANPKYMLIDLILNERAAWTAKNYNTAAETWRTHIRSWWWSILT